MKEEKRVKQIEKQISELFTELMGIVNTYCDVATPNDVLEKRNGKYRIIKTIFDVEN